MGIKERQERDREAGRRSSLDAARELVVETAAGPRGVMMTRDGSGGVIAADVDMGPVTPGEEDVCVTVDGVQSWEHAGRGRVPSRPRARARASEAALPTAARSDSRCTIIRLAIPSPRESFHCDCIRARSAGWRSSRHASA